MGEGVSDARARRRAERRASVLAAAERVLSAEGMAGLTMDRLAAESGVSKPTVYAYFEDKEAVLGAVALAVIGREVDAMIQDVRSGATGVDGLIAMVRGMAARAAAHPAHALVHELRHLGARAPAVMQGMYRLSARVNDIAEARLREDQGAGRLHPEVQPRRLANIAFLSVQGITSLSASVVAAGGAMRFPLDGLIDEWIGLIERGARISPSDLG